MVQMNVSRKLRFALQKELELIQNIYTPLKWHMHSGIFRWHTYTTIVLYHKLQFVPFESC